MFLCAGIGLVVLNVRYEKAKKKESKAAKEAVSFIKHETMLHLIDEEKFLSKLNTEPPQWMREQIEEDFSAFSHISKEQIDATFAQIKKNSAYPLIVRYRIIDNQLYRYFPPDQSIGTENCGTEKAIKTLMRFVPFEDMDFIISYYDGIPISELTSINIPNDVHITEKKELQAPVLFSAKVKNVPYIVLIPDWRSISEYWANDIKDVLSAMRNTSWEKKKIQAVWRGSLTKFPRLAFCRLSTSHPEILSAKINFQEEDRDRQEQIEKEGLFGGRLKWAEFLECKYLPTIDGVCCAAPAFQWRLLSNSLTIKQESDEIQWFYRAVKPFIHYIPMKNDFSDFFDMIEWAKAHDDQCKQIAANASSFALNNLMMEDVLVYFYHVLKKHSSLQQLDKKVLEKEIRENSRWVNIHYMHELAKYVKKHHLKGFHQGANNP